MIDHGPSRAEHHGGHERHGAGERVRGRRVRPHPLQQLLQLRVLVLACGGGGGEVGSRYGQCRVGGGGGGEGAAGRAAR